MSTSGKYTKLPTVEGLIRKRLTDNELCPEQVDAVIEYCKNHDIRLKEMINMWDNKIDIYPTQLLAIIWMSVKEIALEYIDKEPNGK